MEPNAFPENTYGYGAQLMFEDGKLAAVYLRDDYESWYDVDKGIIGSNLTDANMKASEIPESYEEYLRDYLDAMHGYYTVINTNDRRACMEYLTGLKLRNEGWTVDDAWRSDDVFIWTTERIKNVASNYYTAFVDEFGEE